MAGRTLADVTADYTAVHTAYLKAVELEQAGIGEHSIRRASSADLYKQMMTLDAEIKRLSRGGMRIRGGVPVG
jgi:hypothetical protein